MIIFTASDSSEGEEKNLHPSEDTHWFDLPSTSRPSKGQRQED